MCTRITYACTHNYIDLLPRKCPFTITNIAGVLDGCYSKFDDPDDLIPLKTVGSVKVAEMWHGPTGSFKDLALSVVGRLVDYFLEKSGRKANIIVRTSGDTGSAAIHSVLGSKHINIVVWYPRGCVSLVQELQMTTVDAPNVKVFSVEGTTDEADVPLRKISADKEFVSKYNLACFNSVNVSRILLQAVHFTYLYLKICPTVDRYVTFCVPTGGLGNITGCVVARTMGIPLQIVSTVNENDIVDRTFRLNDFSLSDSVVHTPSSAMDIQIPYNIERIFYYLTSQKSQIVRDVMESFERDGRCKLPEAITKTNTYLQTARVDTEELFSAMKQVWQENNYAICPHTAVAMNAGLRLAAQNPEEEIVVIATATPAKFPQVMERGGVPVPRVEQVECLFGLPEHKELVEKGEDWEKRMRDAVASFNQ